MEFKYTTVLGATKITPSSFDQQDFDVSQASQELRDIAPWIDFDSNPDLSVLSFEAAWANKFNENFDGIGSLGAINCIRKARYKPTNIEHKKEDIVGCILEGCFLEPTFGQRLDSYSVRSKNDPFKIALSSIVYRTVNKSFTELIDKIRGSKEDAIQIYASWEIGFNEYDIAVGESRFVKDCEIFSGEEKKSYEEYLKCNGGSGKLSDGRFVYRLIKGEIYWLGIGFTTNPAAIVKPVVAITDYEDYWTQDEEELAVAEKKSKKSSHFKKDAVATDEAEKKQQSEKNNMDAKEVEKIVKEALASQKEQAQVEEATASSIVQQVSEKIKEHSVDYEAKVAEAENAKAEAVKEAEAQKSKIEELEKELETLKSSAKESEKKIEEFEKEKAAIASKELFDSRMTSIDEVYELSDEHRQIIASEVKELDDKEESFASYQKKLEVLLKEKNKEYIASQANKGEETEDKDELETAQAKKDESIPNSTQTDEPSLSEKFSKAFSVKGFDKKETKKD